MSTIENRAEREWITEKDFRKIEKMRVFASSQSGMLFSPNLVRIFEKLENKKLAEPLVFWETALNKGFDSFA